MLGDFHPACIKHILIETIATVCLFAHCAMRVDCLSNIYYLVRVQCHDFSLASYLVKLASARARWGQPALRRDSSSGWPIGGRGSARTPCGVDGAYYRRDAENGKRDAGHIRYNR